MASPCLDPAASWAPPACCTAPRPRPGSTGCCRSGWSARRAGWAGRPSKSPPAWRLRTRASPSPSRCCWLLRPGSGARLLVLPAAAALCARCARVAARGSRHRRHQPSRCRWRQLPSLRPLADVLASQRLAAAEAVLCTSASLLQRESTLTRLSEGPAAAAADLARARRAGSARVTPARGACAVQGPKGELVRTFSPLVKFEREVRLPCCASAARPRTCSAALVHRRCARGAGGRSPAAVQGQGDQEVPRLPRHVQASSWRLW